ncbi:MAG: tripartite tricarboxylate transporter TctB family protein [Woeseiaceae bacterium]
MTIKAILNGRVGTALVMLLIFMSMSLMALGFTDKARLMPLLVGIPGILLGIVQLTSEIRQSADEADSDALSKAERNMFLWVFIFFFGLLGFGFIYAAPIVVFAFMYAGKKESLLVALISAAGTWAVLFGFFERVMEIPLFKGLIVEWLLG